MMSQTLFSKNSQYAFSQSEAVRNMSSMYNNNNNNNNNNDNNNDNDNDSSN